MRYKTTIAVLTILILAIGSIVLLWQATSGVIDAAGDSSEIRASINEGDRRDEILKAMTRDYVGRGVEVSEAMASGAGLAPVDFLNQELSRKGAKWRVRDTAGEGVEIYNIS